MPRAYTRAVSPRLAECELTHLDREPISAETAAKQHGAYEQALAAARYDVVRMPDLDAHADGVFVEDTAILLGDHAVITRPGAASRRPETESTAAALAKDFEVRRLDRGTVDGGDVLRIGRTLYVGLSRRTDRDGVTALSDAVAPLGYEVTPVELNACLHLKSAASYLGEDGDGRPRLLVNPDWVDTALFNGVEPLAIAPSEPFAANVVRLSDRLIVAAAHPRTADRLREAGFNAQAVEVSELAKAEAGLTCMSLIDDRP
jgi:dimethylargininase